MRIKNTFIYTVDMIGKPHSFHSKVCQGIAILYLMESDPCVILNNIFIILYQSMKVELKKEKKK